jgi:hypothetical protein
MPLRLPSKANQTLRRVVERINADVELHQLWRSANVNAVDRSGISDHGEVHIRITTNLGLKMLRLLVGAGIDAGICQNHGLEPNDAEVVVALALCLHDVGIAIHREDRESYSLILAAPKARELLEGVYQEPEKTIVVSEVLHAIAAHQTDTSCLTLEAGVVKVADALDLTKGRSRIPFEAGKINIHSVSAAAIEKVALGKGEDKPVSIQITMNNSAGIFQLDELLKRKLMSSSIADYVEVVANIEAEAEPRLVKLYAI